MKPISDRVVQPGTLRLSSFFAPSCQQIASAMTIQKEVRGLLARRICNRHLLAASAINAWALHVYLSCQRRRQDEERIRLRRVLREEMNAVTRIQALTRGCAARRAVMHLGLVTRQMQRIVRGRLGRKEAKRRAHARSENCSESNTTQISFSWKEKILHHFR